MPLNRLRLRNKPARQKHHTVRSTQFARYLFRFSSNQFDVTHRKIKTSDEPFSLWARNKQRADPEPSTNTVVPFFRYGSSFPVTVQDTTNPRCTFVFGALFIRPPFCMGNIETNTFSIVNSFTSASAPGFQ